MNKNKNSIFLSLLIIISVVVLLNFLNNKLHFRADFTADERYTLSKATKNILSSIDEPVTVTAYFSDNLPPDIAKTKQDFEDLLAEYNSRSNGMLAYEFINPNGDDEAEAQAAKSGIQPIMINVREKNESKQQRAYMGAVIQYQNKKELMPFIQPGAAMEYSLSTGIKKLTSTNKAKIGIIQGFGSHSMQQLGAAMNSLSVLYDVVPVYLNDSLYNLTEYKTIAIMAPKDSIPAYFFSQLDKYLSEGGNLFIAYDHVVGELQNNPPMGKSITTGMEAWLSNKGITIESNLVIDAHCGSVSVQQSNFPFPVQIQFPYLPIITNYAEHPITEGLENVIMQFASSLNFTGAPNVEFTPLAMSSENAATVAAPVYFDVNKQWTEDDFPLSNIPIMGLLKGQIVGTSISQIVLVGDGDFPVVQAQQGAEMSDNVNLMINAIDFMSDDTGLIDLRTKGVSSRPIDQMEDSSKTLLKWLNFLVPIFLVIIYGIIRVNMRRNKRIRRMEDNYVR